MYRSTNGRASLAEPEIWFRIVHVAVPARARAVHTRAGGDGTNGAPVAAPAGAAEFRDAAGRYREQTVEIALGPLPAPRCLASRQAGKGAFENDNVGRLTCLRRGFGRQARRVPTDQAISAISPPRGKPKPPKAPRTPRVVDLLRKALEWQALLASGEALNQPLTRASDKGSQTFFRERADE